MDNGHIRQLDRTGIQSEVQIKNISLPRIQASKVHQSQTWTVYREHNEQEIEQWEKETKPKLTTLWNSKNVVILAEDEMILTTQITIQKVWLPQGEYPKIECSTGGRKRRSVYGFLNMKTGDEHSFKTEQQNMHVTREILKKVRNIYPKQKIALLWDNAGWHKGSVVQEYIKNHKNI